MTAKYPGGFLTDTAPVQFPALGGATNGIWNLNQAAYAAQTQSWAMYDPYWKNVTLMLNGDGTNGAQNNTFVDSSSNNFTITRNGNTTQGTFSPYGDLWSNYFDGSGDYLQIASNSAFNMNTYCSFEAWVCYSSLGTNTLISGRDSSYWLAYNFTSIGGTSNKFVFTINNGSSWQAVSSTTTPSVGVWYHVVGVKDGSTLRIYINGVQENTASFSGSPTTPANVFGIGANQNTQNMDGYISNVRLILGSSSGVLPYTSNFTPSTAPLTAVSGTSLLTCQSNRFKDNSSNNFTLTVNGNTSVQRFSPFNPTAPYSATTIGGSGYFDGTGDYLSVPSSAALGFGTGDFTMEAWVYFTSSDTSEFGLFGIDYPAGVIFEIYQRKLYLGCRGTAYDIGASVEVPQNAWTHLAITRSSNTVTLWQNGVSVGTGTITRNYPTGTGYIGVYAPSGPAFPGYISNLRIVKGTAVYTSAFTPPSAPLTAITNTQLLTNFTNAGIPDAAMMNDLETVGNAQVSTSVKKYGTGSLAFDGSGDYLQIQAPPLFLRTWWQGSFTIEYWIYANAFASGGNSDPIIVGNMSPTTSNNYWSFGPVSGGTVKFYYYNGSTQSFSTTTTLSTGQWYHLAFVNNAGSLSIYINGVSSATSSISGTPQSGSEYPFTIGSTNNTSFNGYIDDLRITKGYARYTANFTPPTSALQNF